MKRLHYTCAILILFGSVLCNSLSAQTQETPAFEVASIKPAPSLEEILTDVQSGKRGIGSLQTTITDGRADFGYVLLNNMIMYAYGLKDYQIAGPEWMSSRAFEIHATIPEGVSKDQTPEMMQSLLKERFKLAAHRETNELPVYALIVSKDGHKLKEAVADVEVTAAAEDPSNTPHNKNNDGKGNQLSLDTPEGRIEVKQEGSGMVMSGGKTGQIRVNMGQNGAISYEISKVTMADFSQLLTQLLDRPVIDMTDLKGAYQVALEIPMEELLGMAQRLAPKMGISLPPGIGGAGALVGAAPGSGGLAASAPSGGSIFDAVRKLGLKLDSEKAPVETLVIDHIEKAPTEN